MSAPKISIVLPARDAGDTVAEAIESCLAQSLEDLELILVDHGSLDATGSIMKTYARRDSRVRLLERPRSEPFTSVLNRAWRSCESELIARMDADDVSHPKRLQLQVAFMASNPDIAGCGTLVSIRRRRPGGPHRHAGADEGYARYEEWINSVVTPERIAAERFVDSPLANPSTVVRRSVFEMLGGYDDAPWAEDYDYWLRLLESGQLLGKVNRMLLDWFDSDLRATRRLERYSQDNFHLAKAHYLGRLPIVRQRGVAICGAGPIGKRLARRLAKGHDTQIVAFFEVNEKRIGNRIGGVPVLPGERLRDFRNHVLVGAVGLRGGRDRIRAIARDAGFIEGIDFFCIA